MESRNIRIARQLLRIAKMLVIETQGHQFDVQDSVKDVKRFCNSYGIQFDTNVEKDKVSFVLHTPYGDLNMHSELKERGGLDGEDILAFTIDGEKTFYSIFNAFSYLEKPTATKAYSALISNSLGLAHEKLDAYCADVYAYPTEGTTIGEVGGHLKDDENVTVAVCASSNIYSNGWKWYIDDGTDEYDIEEQAGFKTIGDALDALATRLSDYTPAKKEEEPEK